jgi:hypothetical protein
MSTVKKVILTFFALILTSTSTLAETINERVIKSITDKVAFDRVFYTTMQTVINGNPKMGWSPPGAENPGSIQVNCTIGDNGDTYCRTSYTLSDGTDFLVASLDLHSSGKIEKTLTAGGINETKDVKTGEIHGGSNLILSEDGGLLFYGNTNIKSLREHW